MMEQQILAKLADIIPKALRGRELSGVCIATGTALFVPDRWLAVALLDTAQDVWKPVVGGVFWVTASLHVSAWLYRGVPLAASGVRSICRASTRRWRLHHLTNDEQVILAHFIAHGNQVEHLAPDLVIQLMIKDDLLRRAEMLEVFAPERTYAVRVSGWAHRALISKPKLLAQAE